MTGASYTHLKFEKMKEDQRLQSNYSSYNNQEPYEIPWIERLIATPILDHRKLCLWAHINTLFRND